MNSLLIYPLAAKANVGGEGAMTSMFGAIREGTLENVEVYKSVVLVMVSLFLVFKVVKLSYNIMSDEQQAGFGGIRLWDILRPLVIVMLIQCCGTFIQLFDTAVDTVSTTIMKEVAECSVATEVKTGNIIDVFEVKGVEYDITSSSGRKAAAEAATGEAIEDAKEAENQALKEAQAKYKEEHPVLSFFFPDGYLNETFQSDEVKEKVAAAADNTAEVKEAKIDFAEALGEYLDCGEELEEPRSWLAAGSQWLYDRLVMVVTCCADIILCCFAMFLPLALALSVIEKWKDTFKSWVGAYIQISMWKVTVAVINWVIVNSRALSLQWIADNNLAQVTEYVEGTVSSIEYVNSGEWLLASIGISFAGILCLLMTPAITQSILSLANTPKEMSDMTHSSMMAPVSAIGGIGKMAGKFF